jgi:hypothetical protein
VTIGERKMINEFLKRYSVDVCRSLAVLIFSGAITDTMAMIVQPAFTGKLTLNIGPIIALWLGCALWMRRSWARKLLIGFGWIAVLCIVGATIRVAFFGDMTLTFYGTEVTKPTTAQYVSLLIVAAPAAYVLLRIFHSDKFKEEISSAIDEKKEPIQSSQPTPGS